MIFIILPLYVNVFTVHPAIKISLVKDNLHGE